MSRFSRSKLAAKVVLITCLILTILVGGLVSPLGTPLIRYIAVSQVPGLSIASMEGSVLGELSIDTLQWENAQWRVQVSRVDLAHDWTCLLQPRVCVHALSVGDVNVTQLAPAPASSEETTPLTLPFPIAIDALSLASLKVTMGDQTIALTTLNTAVTADESVNIKEFTLNSIDIVMPQAQTGSVSGPPPTALSYTPPELPTVTMPIDVDVQGLTLHSLRILQGDAAVFDGKITASRIHTDTSTVSLDSLTVVEPRAEISLDGSATLSQDYPLSFNISARAPIEGAEQKAQLTLDGSLAQLDLSLLAEGLINATAEGKLALLQQTLPAELTVNWPAQSLPIEQDVSLDKGALQVSGEMGNYRITLDGGVNVSPLDHVPFHAKLFAGDEQIQVSSLNARLLGGEINNTGTLYFLDNISWSGNTTIQTLDTTHLIAGGPKDLNGQFTSHFRQTENGPNAVISDLGITGTLRQLPLSLQGSLVYSAFSDILVADLTAKQQDNEITVLSQLFHKRYLNAQTKLNIVNLQGIVPQLTGAVTANLNTYGSWEDPVFDSEINLKTIHMSPRLNRVMAEQGPLNGTIKLSGKLSEHELITDLTVPDHHTHFDLQGTWENQQWQGTVKDSQVAVLNTQWQLDKPFTMQIDTQHLAASVSAHCWQSRENGELCIDKANYEQEQAAWSINAHQLPVGLWIHELYPSLVSSVSDATFGFDSTGSFDPQQQLKAQLHANITPSTWTLGNKGQVKITLDNVSIDGELQNGQLTANSQLISPQLGQLNTHIESPILADQPTVSGNIRIDDWQLAPFKPLAKAIKALNGQINGDITLSGELTRPSLEGKLALRDGQADIDGLPVDINNWQQQLTFSGQRAEFNGEFALGEGPGTLSGSVNWVDKPEIDLTVKGTEFFIKQRDIQLRVSPDITTEIRPGLVKVTGEVGVPWARIKVDDLPPNAVSASKDVHLRGEPPSQDPLDIIDATVAVKIDSAQSGEVKLDAFGLTANLYGNLEVHTQPSLTGYGDLQILDGRYQAYGQSLIIRTGEVQFNGPIGQPLLLVEAIRDPDRTADDVVAGVRIDGSADSPNVSLFSEPSMDQAQNLAYLLNGSGSLEGGDTSDSAYTAMLLGFGLSKSESLTSKVGDAIGISDFSISTTGQGDDTKVAVTGRISKDLSIRYGVGVFGDSDNGGQEVALRYQLMPKLYLEVVRSLYTAVDIYYQFTLGDNNKNTEEKEGAATN